MLPIRQRPRFAPALRCPMLPAISHRLEWVADAAIAQLWRCRLGITCGARVAFGAGAWCFGNVESPAGIVLALLTRCRECVQPADRRRGASRRAEAVGQEAVGKKRSRKRSH